MKLSARARSNLPDSAYGGPDRSFPMPDKGHARAALSMVGRSLKAGHVTQGEADRIRARAKAMIRGTR